MSGLQVGEASYGRWTPEFQRLLALANEVEFFRTDVRVDASVVELAERLVELLAEPQVARIESGDWKTCGALMGTVDAWADDLGRAIEAETERIMSDLSLRALIVPPLWPVPGMLNVVEVVVAEKNRVLGHVSPEFEEVGWRLGCAVEKWAWGTLRWPIARDGVENPYELALRLAVKGVYTLGKRTDELVMFGFGSGLMRETAKRRKSFVVCPSNEICGRE